MRALCVTLLLLAAGCPAARPPPASGAPPPCDTLALVGAAEPEALAADPLGGLALAGGFSGTLRAGPATAASAGGADVFVLRTAPDGSVRWLHRLGGAGEERAAAVALSREGDAAVSGAAGGRCFAARLGAADGREIWRAAFDADSTCRALAFDAQGDLWMAGSFSGSLFGRVASAGMTDIFVARFSGASGEVQLLRGIGGKGRDLARALAISPQGEVLVAGQFGGEVDVSEAGVDFGKGPVQSAGDFDAFLLALGADGATRWVATFGDNGDDDLAAIAVGVDGAIYGAGHHQPAGNYQGLVPRGVGSYTAIGARWSAAGRGEWVRVFEGDSSDALGLALDQQGRVWLAGAFLGELRLGALRLSSAGKRDAFAAALSPVDGEALGSRTWGSREEEAARAVARIPGGIAIAGWTRGELEICGRPVGSAGEQTAFLAWLRDLAR